MTRTYFTIDS